MFDIHSHILPGVDDGAKDMEESIKLLEMMKNDGITCVLATPHFYPQDTNIEDFLSEVSSAYKSLISEKENKDLPNVYLGCEMLYFDGLGNSTSLGQLCLNGSNFLLLELTDYCINDRLLNNLTTLIKQTGIMPIIAHIERYCKAKNYKKLLTFVLDNRIPVQLNASSFFIPLFKRPLKKLLKSNAIVVLGTDAHSCDQRPPRLYDAMELIEKKYGSECKDKLIKNSSLFYKRIIGKAENI